MLTGVKQNAGRTVIAFPEMQAGKGLQPIV
jgi:hypothetical protein